MGGIRSRELFRDSKGAEGAVEGADGWVARIAQPVAGLIVRRGRPPETAIPRQFSGLFGWTIHASAAQEKAADLPPGKCEFGVYFFQLRITAALRWTP